MARRRFRIGIVIWCVILALILWGFVALTRYYEAEISIPLIVHPPPNQALLSTVPLELTVRVRGTGIQLLNLKYVKRSSTCLLDLGKLQGSSMGVYTVEREHFARAISTPEPVRILTIYPASVTMATGDLFVKKVPVSLRTNIATRDGFVVVGQPRSEPPEVEVRGTQSVIESIVSWPTYKLSLADLYTFTSDVVNMSDSLTTLLNVVPPKVRVLVDVQQAADATIPDVPVEPTTSVAVYPSTIHVIVRGGVDEVAALTASDFHVHLPDGVRGYVKPDVSTRARVQVVATVPAFVRTIHMASP